MEDQEIEIQFSQVLKKLRQKDSINQVDLAEKINLDRSAVANYERGHRIPSIEVLLNISDFFGVSLDYLIRGSSRFNLANNNSLVNQELMAENVALMQNNMNLNEKILELEDHIEVLENYIESQKKYVQLLERNKIGKK